jgi:hypothetical protein
MKKVLGAQLVTDSFLELLQDVIFPEKNFQEMQIEERGIEVADGQEYNFLALSGEELPQNDIEKIEKALTDRSISFTWEYPY